MTVILVIQAFFFGDGGILTLGANIVNMGVIGVYIPWIVFIVIYRLKPGRIGMMVGAFSAALLGDLAAAVSAAVMLGLSVPVFPYSFPIALLVMGIHHSIIGVVEGVASAVILLVINGVRSDLLTIPRVVPFITGDWSLKLEEVI
jgi:cobalt/nickel transport system permease protein